MIPTRSIIVGPGTGRVMWAVEKRKGGKLMMTNGRRIFTQGQCSSGAVASQYKQLQVTANRNSFEQRPNSDL